LPKKTIECIVKTGAHFLIQVKKNTSALHRNIKEHISQYKPISIHKTEEYARGRVDERVVELFRNNATLPNGWNHIVRFIRVTRSGLRDNKPYHKVSIYILSKAIDKAEIVANGIRGHWGIENHLHWVKDAILKEDKMTIRDKNSAIAVSFFNTIALNILRTSGYKAIKDIFALFANKVKELNKLLFKRVKPRT
jgi:predicted transposase YbfD/YdcC